MWIIPMLILIWAVFEKVPDLLDKVLAKKMKKESE
jgi:hypothetical protein